MKIVDFSDSRLTDAKFELAINENLDCEELDISDNTTLTRGTCLAKLTRLRVLNMRDTGITDISFLLKLKDTLVFLNLSDVSIVAEDFNYLKELKQLKELHAKRTKIGFNFGVLASLSNLTHLDLAEITSPDFSPLKHLSYSVTDLNLSESNITDSDLIYLSDLKLITLSLGLTAISNLSPLAKIISLQKLQICDTRVTHQGLNLLLQLQNLMTLSVDEDMRDSRDFVLEEIRVKREKKCKIYLERIVAIKAAIPVVTKNNNTDSFLPGDLGLIIAEYAVDQEEQIDIKHGTESAAKMRL